MSHREFPLARRSADRPPISVSVGVGVAAVTVTVTGELAYGTTHVLTDVVERVVRDLAPARVVLDLAGVVFCCSAGIHALLDVHRRITDASAGLTLYRPSHPVRLVLRITGDDRVFDIRTELSEAR
jgi:anti-anti-sigma factor